MAKKPSIKSNAAGFNSSEQLNANLQALRDAFDNTVSRDGSGPNQMQAALDMNSQPILNLPRPVSPNEPLRLADIDNTTSDVNAALVVLVEMEAEVQELIDDVNTGMPSKAPIANPSFTGIPTADTAAPGTNTSQLATTGFVTTADLALQADIDGKQPLDATLTGASGINVVTNDILLGSATNTFSAFATGATGRGLLAAEDVVAAKTLMSLENVSNTPDSGKPISTATQTALDLKQDLLPAGGSTGQVLQGDLTWLTPTKGTVGLSNVDDTTDLDKPISTATQTALNNKLSLTGGTLSGPLTINGSLLSDNLVLGGPAASNPVIQLSAATAGQPSIRWLENNIREYQLSVNTSGQLALFSYNQSTGALIGTVFSVAAGAANLSFGQTPGCPTAPAGSNSALMANTAYVDGAVASAALGIVVLTAARAATTANITLSAPQTIDGVSVIAGDRVLVKDQTLSATNGVYVVAAGAWTRATDMDSWAETVNRMVPVTSGTLGASTLWVSTTQTGGTLNTTAINFNKNAVGIYTAGTGIDITSNVVSLPVSGVSAGQYQKLTVNAQGIVTAGSNATLTAAEGGTGYTSLSALKTGLSLDSVDNTPDTGKPVSTAQQTALNAKVNLAGDTMTGDLIVGTAADTSNRAVTARAATSAAAGFNWYSGANMAWWLYRNANNDLIMSRRDPSNGNQLSIPWLISSSTGITSFAATPTAPTMTTGNSSSSLATTAFVQNQLAASGASTFIQAGTGAVTRTTQNKARDFVNIADFGAALNGTTDDTAAWQAALNTGKNIRWEYGKSKITDMLTFKAGLAALGQHILGADPRSTKFVVDYASFNMSAVSIIKISWEGQGMHRVGFEFVQPDQALRANLKQYPWVVDLNSKTRCEFTNILIGAGYKGFSGNAADALGTGNVGGLRLENIEIGTFSSALMLDGCQDSIYIENFRHWPYDTANIPNLLRIFSDGTNNCWTIGRVDDLNVDRCIPFASTLVFQNGSDGNPTFAHLSHLSVDSTFSRIIVSGEAILNISNLYLSTSGLAYPDGVSQVNETKLQMSGGQVRINNLWGLHVSTTSGNDFIRQSGGVLQIDNALIDYHPSNRSIVNLTGGALMMNNVYLKLVEGQVRTQPAIKQTGGRLIAHSVRASDAVGGTGPMISIAADDWHVITDCAFMGWTYVTPVVQSVGVYGPNTIAGTSNWQNNFIAGARYMKRLTGTLDATGGTSNTHGIPNLNTRVLDVAAFAIDGSSNRIPITVSSVGATSVSLAGGAGNASRPYEIKVEYSGQ